MGWPAAVSQVTDRDATGARSDPDATRMLGAMAALDPLARGCTVALLLMMGLVLLRARPRTVVAWATCGLFASIASYLAGPPWSPRSRTTWPVSRSSGTR